MGDKLKNLNYKKLHLNLFLILCSVSFIYSLGFATNFRVLRASHRSIYDMAQVSNKIIFNLSVLGLFLAVAMLMSGYKNKKKMNLGQKILVASIGIYTIVNSKLSIGAIKKFKAVYLEGNYSELENYVVSSRMFTLGTVISIALAVTFISLTYIVLMKEKRGR